MTLKIIVPGPLKKLYFAYRELMWSIKFIKLINNLEHNLLYFPDVISQQTHFYLRFYIF